MGNSVSSARDKPDRLNNRSNDSTAPHTLDLQPDRRPAAAAAPAPALLAPGATTPAVVTAPSHNDSKKAAQFRLSVTASIDERADQPPSAANNTLIDQLPESGGGQDNGTAGDTKPLGEGGGGSVNVSRPVPVSTGKPGWVSSTGNNSPWYGSLSSSTSSHHPSESVRGPYYRTRGMSVNRDSEIAEEEQQQQQQQQQQQRITRKPSVAKDQQPKGVTTIITWSQGGHNVYVTGTFNGWKHKIKLVKSTHDFSAVLELPPGTHRLKFIVDDEWKCSNEMETATDPDGNLVNYLQVLDENDESFDEFGDTKPDPDTISRSSTPDSAYISEIPQELLALASALPQDEQGKQASLDWDHRQPQPPSLPPHLEKVLLNSQAVSEEDNSVLPEPNHVTLNHLYASSIKDNVMALSTTTRYRKKYVTTMYYRPVSPKS